ncbi:MAG: hypothetical protein ACREJ0_06200 [Geminicoccaceae bacterium]
MDSNTILALVIGLAIAVLVVWLLWRICVWCLALVSVVSLWLLALPPMIYIPLMVILAVIAWPVALLALFGWLLLAIFPGLIPDGEDPENWRPRLRRSQKPRANR